MQAQVGIARVPGRPREQGAAPQAQAAAAHCWTSQARGAVPGVVGLPTTGPACLAFPPPGSRSDSFQAIKGNNLRCPSPPPSAPASPWRCQAGLRWSQNQFAGLWWPCLCMCLLCKRLWGEGSGAPTPSLSAAGISARSQLS